jgi:hypothetical protein
MNCANFSRSDILHRHGFVHDEGLPEGRTDPQQVCECRHSALPFLAVFIPPNEVGFFGGVRGESALVWVGSSSGEWTGTWGCRFQARMCCPLLVMSGTLETLSKCQSLRTSQASSPPFSSPP